MPVKTVLVTGSTGIVGNGMCRYFLDRGYRVIGSTRKEAALEHQRFQSIHLDLSDESSFSELRAALPEVDLIIHCGAVITRSPDATIEENINIFNVNFLGTYRLLKEVEKFEDKKFIFISGTRLAQCSEFKEEESIAYGNTDEYSTSKLAAELACHQFTLNKKVSSATLRISAPYGYVLNNAVVSRFVKQVMANETITLWGTGARQQVFTFVEDVAYAAELAFEKKIEGIFNITGGHAVTMKELAEAVIAAFPESTSKIHFEDKEDPQEGNKAHYSIDKAKEELGYKPQFNIKDGLLRVAESLKVKQS